jgi:hypothetical protein
MEKNMNENNLTQTAVEQQYKSLATLIKILMTAFVILASFSAGYYVAMSEAAAHIKTILN